MRQAIMIIGIFAILGIYSTPSRADLDETFAFYRELRDFRADFQQTKRLESEGLELRGRGTLHVSLGKALLWDVVAPARLTIFLDDRQLAIRSGEGKAASETRYDLTKPGYSQKIAENVRDLAALLAMNHAEVEGRYTVKDEKGTLTLTPKTPRQLARIQLHPSAGNWIQRLTIEEVSGDRLTFDFERPEKIDATWTAQWNKGG
jgi:outer membrane lipoprotein-sorting protein